MYPFESSCPGEVPYSELYYMAEQAYNCWDEAEVAKACREASYKWKESYKVVYNKVRALMMKEFHNA